MTTQLLPTEPTPPKTEMGAFTTLVYGVPKIGKSTFASHAPDAIFLATEAGLNSLNVHQVAIDSWATFLQVCGEIMTGEHTFKTVVIDTVDKLYKLCSEHVLADAGVKHESDLGYGKGWALVNGEFERVLTKLSLLPQGLILISHAQLREVDDRTGGYTKAFPTLPESARKIVLAMSDFILYFEMESYTTEDGKPEERRVIRTKPAKNYEAGDRTGRLPDTLPMSYDAFEAKLKLAA